jgi:hypothetical protein
MRFTMNMMVGVAVVMMCAMGGCDAAKDAASHAKDDAAKAAEVARAESASALVTAKEAASRAKVEADERIEQARVAADEKIAVVKREYDELKEDYEALSELSEMGVTPESVEQLQQELNDLRIENDDFRKMIEKLTGDTDAIEGAIEDVTGQTPAAEIAEADPETENWLEARQSKAKWLEAMAAGGTISSGIKVYSVVNQANGTYGENLPTMADLGFEESDLEGTHFDDTDYSWVTARSKTGVLTFTITIIRPAGVGGPAEMTLDETGTWTP